METTVATRPSHRMRTFRPVAGRPHATSQVRLGGTSGDRPTVGRGEPVTEMWNAG